MVEPVVSQDPTPDEHVQIVPTKKSVTSPSQLHALHRIFPLPFLFPCFTFPCICIPLSLTLTYLFYVFQKKETKMKRRSFICILKIRDLPFVFIYSSRFINMTCIIKRALCSSNTPKQNSCITSNTRERNNSSAHRQSPKEFVYRCLRKFRRENNGF